MVRSMSKAVCNDCRYQMTGWDGGFFGEPMTCECKIYGVTEGRKSCSKFKKKVTKADLLRRVNELEKENEFLRKEGQRRLREIKLLRKQYSQIPPKIREVWKE